MCFIDRGQGRGGAGGGKGGRGGVDADEAWWNCVLVGLIWRESEGRRGEGGGTHHPEESWGVKTSWTGFDRLGQRA